MPWRDAPVVAEAGPVPQTPRRQIEPVTPSPSVGRRPAVTPSWQGAPEMGAAAPGSAPAVGAAWEQAPAAEPDQPRETSRLAAVVHGITQGATLGFADEIAAGMAATVRRPFSGGRSWRELYDEQLAEERGNLSAAREAHPVLGYGSEVAGAIGTGTGILRGVGQLAPRLGSGQRLTATGATEGALYGAGTSEEGGRGTGAAIGGTVGAALPVPLQRGMSAAGSAIGTTARALTDTPERKARRLIGEAMERDRLAPTEAVDRLAQMGPEGRLADLGENLGGLARAVTARPGPARTTARDFLEERQAGQAQRLIRQAGLDDVPAFRRSFQQFMTQRHSEAAPLYEQAYAASLDLTSPQMQALLQRPSMQRALREAQTILQDEGGGGGHVRLMDAAKRHLDDRIGSALRQGERDTARRLISLRNELLTEVDRQVPAFAQARATYAGEASMRDAAQLGRNLFGRRLDLDDAELVIERMGPGERMAFQRGALRGLVDTLENMASTHDAGRKLVASPRQREVMRLAFQDERSVQALIQAAETESQFSATRNVVRGGSPTARIQEEVAGLDQTAGIGAALRQGNVVGAATRLLRAFGIGKPSDETLEEVGRLLFAPGAARTARALPQPSLPAVSPEVSGGALIGTGAATGAHLR